MYNSSSQKPFRIQPAVTLETEHFWTGGKNNQLCFLHCQDCATWIHPPQPICPECTGKNLKPKAASGKGAVHSYTINRQAWIPGFDPPYVVGLVEIDEDPRVRLMTNIVNCDVESVFIGMKVQVLFEAQDNGVVFIPLFEPCATQEA
jgi:uncharacterized OB-fold protein